MLVEGGDVMEEYNRFEAGYERMMQQREIDEYRREVEERMRYEMEEMYGQKLAAKVAALDSEDDCDALDDDALMRLGVL